MYEGHLLISIEMDSLIFPGSPTGPLGENLGRFAVTHGVNIHEAKDFDIGIFQVVCII